jgi:hypothetical protein
MAISIPSDTRGGRLAALRSKTDRDLARLLQRALETGLCQARESSFGDAENLYRHVKQLLPLLERLPESELLAMRLRAAELRSELDQAALTTALAS